MLQEKNVTLFFLINFNFYFHYYNRVERSVYIKRKGKLIYISLYILLLIKYFLALQLYLVNFILRSQLLGYFQQHEMIFSHKFPFVLFLRILCSVWFLFPFFVIFVVCCVWSFCICVLWFTSFNNFNIYYDANKNFKKSKTET